MKFSSPKIERLTGLPLITQPNQFYLVEAPNTTALLYLSDSSSNLILLNAPPTPPTIGQPVVDGLPGCVIFVDTSGNLGQDNGHFLWDEVLDRLVIGGDVYVQDDAYNATTWNANFSVPTKNAVRDKIESLTTGIAIGNPVTGGGANRVLYEDGSSNLAANASFFYNGDLSISKSGGNDYTEFQATNNGGTSAYRVAFGVAGTATGDLYQNRAYYLSGASLDGLLFQAAGSGNMLFYIGAVETMRLTSSALTAPSVITPAITTTTAQLALSQTGDTFGASFLYMRNRAGSAGAIFQNAGLDLVDMGFLANSGEQFNFRFEHRGAFVIAGNTNGEFQFFRSINATPYFAVGESYGAHIGSFLFGVYGVPSAQVHIISTTEQLRIAYDGSNYFKTTVGSTGGVTFDASGSGANFTFSDNVTYPGGATFRGYTTSGGAPTTTELPNDKDFSIHKDTGGVAWYLAFNAAGVIKKAALT